MTQIVSATWSQDRTTIRVELDDGTVMWVPDDMANRHRVELAEWEKQGNKIADDEQSPQPKT